MSNRQMFQWARTALITPFNADGSIDRVAFERLVQMQCEAKVAWILFLGTTWENPTLSSQEGLGIVSRWIQLIQKCCKVMVNVWTNSTAKSISNMEEMEKITWIDAFLIVNPYYNKPTQTWLYLHFAEIAKHTSKPVFIYNIAWRTGINLETETLLRIAHDCPNVVGVKEASGNLDQIRSVIQRKESDFLVLSGDDGLTLDVIKAWGDGVISVASNALPAKVVNLVSSALNGNISDAEKINAELHDFFEWQFLQTNPLPIKTALANMWIIQEYFRLPMCQMDEEPKKKRLKILEGY